MTRDEHRHLWRARRQDHRAARGRRQSRRTRGADGGRSCRLRHADRGVAAYRDKVSVVGVGFDIACGNAAIRTDLRYTTGTCRAAPRPCRRRDPGRRVVRHGTEEPRRRCTGWITVVSERPWDAVPGHAREGLRSKAQGHSSAPSAAATIMSTCLPTKPARSGSAFTSGSRGFGHTVASGFLAISQGRKVGCTCART